MRKALGSQKRYGRAVNAMNWTKWSPLISKA
jgi:hypothetical protein